MKFFNLKDQDEVPNDLSLDSAPVDKLKLHPGNEILITCSSDYLKFISVQPPFQMTDVFTIALETIKDITVNNFNITVASSCGDQLMIHRTKIDFFKPFKNQPKSFAPELDGLNTQGQIPHGIPQQTPKILDIAAMPAPTRNRMGPKFKLPEKQEPSKKAPKGISHSPSSSSSSSGRSANSRGKAGVMTPTKAKPTFPSPPSFSPSPSGANSNGSSSSKGQPNTPSTKPNPSSNNTPQRKVNKPRYDLNSAYGNNPAFSDYKKNRASFMTKMNDRYSHLSRINDILGTEGLSKALENAVKTNELGPELLTILRMKPDCIKFEHSIPMLQICDKICQRERELVVSTIEGLMQAFGRLVVDTLSHKELSKEPVFEERLKRATKFAELFKTLAPFLRTVAVGQSTSAGTAGELVDEWQVLLK